MDIIIGAIIGLIILVALVVLHELGHAIAARRNGVVVEEFGIGFPPTAWKKKLKNGVLFTLNWLPIGGFVRLKGEHDAASGKGTYGAASFWVKTKILLAGVAINWVTAALIFTMLALFGLPKLLPNQVTLPFDTRIETSPVKVVSVVDGSSAQRAGLQPGDELLSIAGTQLNQGQQVTEVTSRERGRSVTIAYRRDGQDHQTTASLAADNQNGRGYLGVASRQTETIHASWSAPMLGVATAGQLTYETVKGLGEVIARGVAGFVGQFSNDATTRSQAQGDLQYVSQSVAGPVGILGVLFPAMWDSGVTQLLFLAAIISLTLAVMNVLPIPALDGGRWFTMAGFRLLRKKLTREREEAIQATGFLLLLVLIVLITFSDVKKFF